MHLPAGFPGLRMRQKTARKGVEADNPDGRRDKRKSESPLIEAQNIYKGIGWTRQ